MKKHVIWEERWRPAELTEVILPHRIKDTLLEAVKDGEMPNMTFVGNAGIGKTTTALAIVKTMKCDHIVINGSKDGNIDTLRGKITDFATTSSLGRNGRKIVILDEADYLNAQSTQPALRNFMSEHARNCGFILTANYPGRIIDPILSRCPAIDFTLKKKEVPEIMAQYFGRCMNILESEGIEYDRQVLIELVKKYFPDFRLLLNKLQWFTRQNGRIDAGVLSIIDDTSLDDIIRFLQDKDYSKVRKWVAEHSDSPSVFRSFYDKAFTYFEEDCIPSIVLLIAKYQFQASAAIDHEVNLSAFMVEVMMEAKWR